MEKYEYSSGAPQMMESTQTKTYPKRRHKYAAFLCALFVFMVCSGFSFDFRLPSDPLKLASAYGDTQATHPSVLHFDEPWNGYTFWIAYSPYPKADDSKENPHILASNDGVNWVLPSGFSNPLDDTPENYKFHVCYNSDPELVYNSDTNELECWWRYVDDSQDQMILYRCRTSDGVHWTEKEAMLETSRSEDDYLSPTLLYENGIYRMWSIGDGYRVKYNEYTPSTGWSATRYAALAYDSDSLRSWHLTVRHTDKGYEMIVVSFDKSSKTYPRGCMSLYYACSEDGYDFGTAKKFFSPSKRNCLWFNKGLYRSTFTVVDGKYYVYFSGISKDEMRGVGLLVGKDIFDLHLR